MKNIIKSTLLLLAGGFLMTACDKDLDHNPTLQSPDTFVLNQPAYANAAVDLASSNELNFSWAQPDYGFPAAATYEMQFSTTNTWTISQAQADADKEGKTIANYGTIGTPSVKTFTTVLAADLAKLLQQIERYAENSVPSTQVVYARAMAVYLGDTIYSNVQKITVVPYYVELRDADPVIYYLVGGCIGDGSWTNNASAIGTGLLPFFSIPGETYDKVTGKGKIEYTGYFPANAEFKIIFTPGDWDHGICGNGTPLGTTVRDGGDDPGNIKIDEAGYYNIVVNTSDNSCTFTKLTTTPTVYPTMLIAGSFNGWAGITPMAAATTYAGAAANHDWTVDVTFDSDGECKFVTSIVGGSWGDNWGSSEFPRGTGVAGGGNIAYKAGSYKVVFNDILKSYTFIAK